MEQRCESDSDGNDAPPSKRHKGESNVIPENVVENVEKVTPCKCKCSCDCKKCDLKKQVRRLQRRQRELMMQLHHLSQKIRDVTSKPVDKTCN